MNNDTFPETLSEAITYFASEGNALAFMIGLRWPDGVIRCPRCESKNAAFMPKRRIWRCRGCERQFSVKVGTIFEDSPLSLAKWLPSLWMIAAAKNGISSCEIARAVGVTQKTAWFMLHRIRLALQNGSIVKIEGTAEVDETFIGGKARNMNTKAKKRREGFGRGPDAMTPVHGLLERTTRKRASRVILETLSGTTAKELQGNVRKYVLKGTTVNTDEHQAYCGLESEYTHKVINHAECYANGHVHTNGMENFWSLLKRTIRGTYVSVEPFHLFRYLDEQAFRFNERKDECGDQGRFMTAMEGVIGRRLTWKKLTGQDGVPDGLPASA